MFKRFGLLPLTTIKMMQASTKPKQKPKGARKSGRQQWAQVERANPFASREAREAQRMGLNHARTNDVALIPPQAIVRQPFEMSQLTAGTAGTVVDQLEELPDIFAAAGTHEMGAGILPPISECKVLHEEENCKKTLMAMLLGLTSTDGRPLGDVTEELYASMRQKVKCHPVAEDLKGEQNRRALSFGLDAFKNTCCSKTKCQEWLKNNPVTNTLDVEFLVATEKIIHDELNDEIEERQQLQEVTMIRFHP